MKIVKTRYSVEFRRSAIKEVPTVFAKPSSTDATDIDSIATGSIATDAKENSIKEEQPQLERVVFEGDILLVDSLDKLQSGLDALAGESVLGFDTESKPAFSKGEAYPPCLLQLSTDSVAVLFRLNSIDLPTELIAILEDKTIKKVGCSVIADVMELTDNYVFSPRGFVEINDIEKELTICGLKSLSVFLFNKRIAKAQARSNWEAETLSKAQINYAAIDAWMGRKIFLELKNRNYDFIEITAQEIHKRELRRKLNKVCPFEDSATVRIAMTSIYDFLSELQTNQPERLISQNKLQGIITKRMSDKNISFGRNKAHKVFGTLIDARCLSVNKSETDRYHIRLRSNSIDELLIDYYRQVSRVMDMTISEDNFPNLIF